MRGSKNVTSNLWPPPHFFKIHVFSIFRGGHRGDVQIESSQNTPSNFFMIKYEVIWNNMKTLLFLLLLYTLLLLLIRINIAATSTTSTTSTTIWYYLVLPYSVSIHFYTIFCCSRFVWIMHHLQDCLQYCCWCCLHLLARFHKRLP